MAYMKEHRYAAQFREVVTRIVKSVIQEDRPWYRVGKVYRYDRSSQSAWVLFAGDTVDDLVKVRVALNMQPNVFMEDTFDELGYEAPGDTVRVWGKPGAYFILDYYSGMPTDPGAMTGEIKIWYSNEPPDGYLLLDGSEYQNEDYPRLAKRIENTWGGTPGVSFVLPDPNTAENPFTPMYFIIKT